MRRGLLAAAVLLGAIAPAGARDNPTVICPAGQVVVRTDDGFDKCARPDALTAPRFGFTLWAPLRDRRQARRYPMFSSGSFLDGRRARR